MRIKSCAHALKLWFLPKGSPLKPLKMQCFCVFLRITFALLILVENHIMINLRARAQETLR